MSDTFSLGFSEDAYNALMDSLIAKLKEFAAVICVEVKSDVTSIANMDKMIADATKNIFDGWFERARREHAYPLRRVLGALPVEEMTELAETW
jgi:hypothetical protein